MKCTWGELNKFARAILPVLSNGIGIRSLAAILTKLCQANIVVFWPKIGVHIHPVLENKQWFEMYIGVIECSGNRSCEGMTFIVGLDVSVGQIICSPGACNDCKINNLLMVLQYYAIHKFIYLK